MRTGGTLWPGIGIRRAANPRGRALARIALLGDVAGDLGKTERIARIVVAWVDHDMRPEAGAVLAHLPSFAFKFSVFERTLRQAVGAVLRRIKAGEMLADDFVGDMALDALGATAEVVCGKAPIGSRPCKSLKAL